MGNRMELSTELNMENGMGFRMGISMDRTMGIRMDRLSSTLSAIGLSLAPQATGPHLAPTNMPCIF